MGTAPIAGPGTWSQSAEVHPMPFATSTVWPFERIVHPLDAEPLSNGPFPAVGLAGIAVGVQSPTRPSRLGWEQE